MKKVLNFNWSFINDFKEEYLKELPKEAKRIDLPHTIYELPLNYFNELDYQIIGTYQKLFKIEENLNNKVVHLVFHGLMAKAHVYLNNYDLGEYVSTYLPFKIDITKFIKEENRLVVIVDAKEDPSIPPFGGTMDYLAFGGIYREVELEITPEVYLENIFINSFINGEIKIKPIVKGDLTLPFEITYELLFDNKVIKKFQENEIVINDPKLWDLNTPDLYTLKTTLKTKDDKHEVISTFGFREALFKEDGFYLNKRKVKLVGLNRHQSYPYVGYAMPKAAQIDDANILKYTLNLNVVRTSHYPQSSHFLKRCDEIGLLVINEVPGWNHISTLPKWRDHFYEFIEKMIKRDYNHPSLIAHGIRINESKDDDELYLKGQELAKKLDPNRQTLGVRNFKDSNLLEDIYAYNDFSCDRLDHGLDNPKTIQVKNKPILITEYLGHMFPTKANDHETRRLEHALRHARVINDNYKYTNLSGAIGWCFTDYNTHLDFGSGDHICYHGVSDIYRNPKYASYIYASQSEENDVLEVLSNFMPGDFDEAILGKTYVATNADYIELYKNEEFVQRFYPNFKMYPHLKHPPILIDDYIGEIFKEEQFRKIHQKKIKEALSYVSLYGLNNLPFKYQIRIGLLMLRYKMNFNDLFLLWNKYVSLWGDKLTLYTIKAYKDDKFIKEKTFGPSTKTNLKVNLTKETLLNEETYDVSRLSIKLVDEYDSICTYAHDVVSIEVSGLIDVIGPKTLPLHAGQVSIYIRSLLGKGKGTLKVKVRNHEKTFDFIIK